LDFSSEGQATGTPRASEQDLEQRKELARALLDQGTEPADLVLDPSVDATATLTAELTIPFPAGLAPIPQPIDPEPSTDDPATEPRFFKGRRVPWPRVVNTLAVPADGYARILELDPNGSTVTTKWKLLTWRTQRFSRHSTRFGMVPPMHRGRRWAARSEAW
jgi:hypothetical protein